MPILLSLFNIFYARRIYQRYGTVAQCRSFYVRLTVTLGIVSKRQNTKQSHHLR